MMTSSLLPSLSLYSSPMVLQGHRSRSHGFFPFCHPPDLHQSPRRSAIAPLSLLRLFLRSHRPPMSPVVSSSLPPPVAVVTDRSCFDLLRHWTTPRCYLLFVIPRPIVLPSSTTYLFVSLRRCPPPHQIHRRGPDLWHQSSHLPLPPSAPISSDYHGIFIPAGATSLLLHRPPSNLCRHCPVSHPRP